jgi:DNA repair protein RadD
MITHLLNKISLNDLSFLVGEDEVVQMTQLVSDQLLNDDTNKKNIIIKTIEAFYGTEILNDKRIRQLIFYTLEESILATLTNKYTKKEYPKAYDNALELSLLPWKAGSEFVNEVARILNIPSEFLPQYTYQNPTTEELVAHSNFFPLHDYQEELKRSIIHNLRNKTKRFLVQMPTGSGKTRTVLQSVIEYSNETLMFQNQRTIVWLAHTEELCEQAIETLTYLWSHLSAYPIKLTRLWGNHNPAVDNLSGGFVIGTLQKFVSLNKSQSYILDLIKENTEILIIDEAHKSVAKSYASMIDFLVENQNTSLIGITATPGRTSANVVENKILASFFNKVLLSPQFDGNPITQLQKKGILSHLNRIEINTQVNVIISSHELEQLKKTDDLPLSTLKTLASNTKRNKLILELLKNEVEKGNPCLIFTCSTDHSKLLNAALNLRGLKSFYVDANTNKFRRKKIIDNFKSGDFDILINYGILSTGFDAPRLRSIIVSRPTSSVVLYSQIIGRGLRGPKMGGGYECNLFDIKDNFKNFGGVDEVYNYFEGYWD